MPIRPTYLRPHDVAVALQLFLTPEVKFAELARRTGLSAGEAHNAVKRLEKTRLLARKGMRPERSELIEFLVHGVPNVYPAELGPDAPGVPTARSGPDLRERLSFESEIVWPSAGGAVRGQSLVPLLPDAAQVAQENPELYRLLALVDALRVGSTRERELGAELLRERLDGAEP